MRDQTLAFEFWMRRELTKHPSQRRLTDLTAESEVSVPNLGSMRDHALIAILFKPPHDVGQCFQRPSAHHLAVHRPVFEEVSMVLAELKRYRLDGNASQRKHLLFDHLY